MALLSSRSDGRDYAKGALEPNVAGDQWSEKAEHMEWGATLFWRGVHGLDYTWAEGCNVKANLCN